MTHDINTALLSRIGAACCLTDGGLETHLIFYEGLDLPQFAAFPLLRQNDGRRALERYFNGFLDTAATLGLAFVLDTVTWRASAGWGARMDWNAKDIDAVNREAVDFAKGLQVGRARTVLVNGIVGPHGDAYRPDEVLTPQAAKAYHSRQITVLAEAGVDLVTAMTISTTGEAIGVVEAARKAGVPVALSFTVETDGRLLGGLALAEAIAQTDAATGSYPVWYGINCAHPDHFAATLVGDHVARIGLVRANASRLSHAELDEATGLDDGDPEQLARDYARLRQSLPRLRVLGGCCGTDLRHVSAIGRDMAHRH